MHHWLYHWVTGHSMIPQTLTCSAWRRRLCPSAYPSNICTKSSQQRTWQSFSSLCDPGWRCWWPGSISPCLCNVTLTHSLEDINPFNAIIWERVKEATWSDPTLQLRTSLYPHISASFPPHKQKLSSETQPYWDVYHNSSCIGEAMVYGSWIVAPNSLYSEVLDA